MSDISILIVPLMFAIFYFLSKSKTGKSLSFGGKIERTLSDSPVSLGGGGKSEISIHLLRNRSSKGNVVGIEIHRSAQLSSSQQLLGLSRAELRVLLNLLKEAEKAL